MKSLEMCPYFIIPPSPMLSQSVLGLSALSRHGIGEKIKKGNKMQELWGASASFGVPSLGLLLPTLWMESVNANCLQAWKWEYFLLGLSR